MTTTEFNLSPAHNTVTFNKGITQIIEVSGRTHIASTMRKDYSFIKMSDSMKVRVQGKQQVKKVCSHFSSLGYSKQDVVSEIEHSGDYYMFIFTK